MRITPLEIRQHTFDKSFRGYDTESVNAFLLSLSQEWERISEDLRFSKQQLEIAEKEIIRMKEIENSLFKTLKAAEDAQQNINAKAEAEASLITDKARQDAEEITNEAQKKANMMISESENKAKFLVEEAVNDLKNYERDFKAMERYKDYLVVELKSFANDALDKVTKFEERINTRTTEVKKQELDGSVGEKLTQPLATVPTVVTPVIPVVVEPVEVNEVRGKADVNSEIEHYSSVKKLTAEPAQMEVKKIENDFEPANDYDDENEELPTVHAIIGDEESKLLTNMLSNSGNDIPTDNFNETADNLTKEMKATRGRPRKLTTNDGGLPTVSSIMEEFTKEVPATISNGGGSFFDNI